MIVFGDEIYIVPSFDFEDHVTKYDTRGKRYWDARFYAKILSWEVKDSGVIVFFKDRAGSSTYLTLIDRKTGRLVWQRP